MRNICCGASPVSLRLGLGRSYARLVLIATISAMATPAWADLSDKSASQGGITIQYKTDTNSPPQTLDLGYFNVTLQNYTDGDFNGAWMRASFEVNQSLPDDFLKLLLIDDVHLHWYQTVVSLPSNDFVVYNHKNIVPNNLPITDPPSNGWDYMWQNIKHTIPVDQYIPFIDSDPFYYTPDAEDNLSNSLGQPLVNYGVEYNMGDIPGDRTDPDGKGADFFTYLVAQNTDLTSHDPLALLPNQMLILGGFEWHNESSDIGIDQTFVGAPDGTLDSISLALLNGGFTGWSAVSDAAIVTAPDPVPEPGTLGLLTGTAFLVLRRRPR